MPEASCIVKLVDHHGVEHRVEVRAGSVYEAAILGVSRLRRHGWEGDGGTIGSVTVEIHKEPTVHRIQVGKMLGWINSSGRTPRDEIRKQKTKNAIERSKVTLRLESLPVKTAAFVKPMECESVSQLRQVSGWVYEIKLDGYRAIAVKAGKQVNLFSRRRKSFNGQYPYIVEALHDLPNDTVVDGEVVALNDSGKPEFNLLQNYRSAAVRIHYFIFDLLVYQGHDVMGLPLEERRKILHSLKFSSPRIHLVEYQETSAFEMLAAVKGLGLEGVIAKRKDSRYEPGKRSGAWTKCRVHKGQEFVIGGYFPGPHGFDSIIVGYYRGKDLMYVARTRNGFVPASRSQVFARLKDKVIPTCPFVNLPETHPARFGRELDAEAMKKAVWLRPEVVAHIEFFDWTEADRLRHSKFVSLREDKDPRQVTKEYCGKA